MAVTTGRRSAHASWAIAYLVSGGRPAPVHFFRDPGELRAWFESHHASAAELWVGYWKKGTHRPGVTFAQAVQEALCFGWVDSQLRSLGPDSYAHRYTPRREGSRWSDSNVVAVRALLRAGRMHASGLRAFRRRVTVRKNSPHRGVSDRE